MLSGSLREAARRASTNIANDLRGYKADGIGASLGRGAAGIAVFSSYFARSVGNSDPNTLALLRRCYEACDQLAMDASLFGGLTGLGWAVEYLNARDLMPDDIFSTSHLDSVLTELLAADDFRIGFDLVSGLVGWGVYALSRLHRSSGRLLCERIVCRLAGRAVWSELGAAWFSHPGSLGPVLNRRAPLGGFNLGIAHGVPGVVAFLAKALARGVSSSVAEPLLRGALAWTLAQGRHSNDGWHFGSLASPSEAESQSTRRVAWCYGDLGVSSALLLATRSIANPEAHADVLRLAYTAAFRPCHTVTILDAGLCHGAAGAGHIFNRLYHTYGSEAFLEASRRWFQHALELCRPGTGFGGFSSRRLGAGGAMEWIADPGLLTGAAGVGLAFEAACSSIEPSWDAILLQH